MLLATGADINAMDNDSWTPLHTSCYLGLLDSIQPLLSAGADLHMEDRKGRTAADVAKEKGYQSIVDLLEECGGGRATKAAI